MRNMSLLFALLLCSLLATGTAQVPAFPGAEGGGMYTTGGRGGKILFVDNLNNKGDGSFREAIEEEGPRIIIFRVSGTIALEKDIHIRNGNLTIAGQTAPGEGICLKNYGMRVDADNVIIRYIRVRTGDKINEENDAATGQRNRNIIIDHCSFSWSNDEVASFYDNEDFTMQWCIISESLNMSDHHKGAHGYGGIWGGLNASFHHNLLSDHTSRNPRLCGSRYSGDPEKEKTDLRNNVIYNWGRNSIYGGEEGNYNIVNNYFKPGPATREKTRSRILELTQEFYDPDINEDTLTAGNFFISGNVVEGCPGATRNNWKFGVQGSDVDNKAKRRSRLKKPVEITQIKPMDATTAYEEVLNHAGASLQRDEVDHRIIEEVRTGTEKFGTTYDDGGKGIIDSQEDVGGWPSLQSTPPPADRDEDGMPDEWEEGKGLEPGTANSDRHDLDANYTNIEVYINSLPASSQVAVSKTPVSEVWVSDNGDGTYTNPVIHADYSDPDVVRVGDDFYMTSSSFNCVPGLPILHSQDLVNWELVGHALRELVPTDVFSMPQHGKGVWAPCIQYHNDEYVIYYPDPDYGIYVVRATDPRGPWSEPLLVKAGKGLIDPSPLWDDDGKTYLAYAFAGSRASVKSVLMVEEMNPEGTRMKGNPVMVFDGHGEQPTVEGPKFYKRNGYYYLFAPAGGVTHGWQLVLRSSHVFGPYEERTVMDQGTTEINGPHQGAWVNTPSGQDWFIHFQDKEAYGRIVHLQPMRWSDNWPVIGSDPDNDGTGEPVSSFRMPQVEGTHSPSTPPESDEFNGSSVGLQWQWNANPKITYGYPSGNLGFFRMNCQLLPEGETGLWNAPNLFMQKFPAEAFTATTRIRFSAHSDGDEAGFVVMGEDYRYISLKLEENNLVARSAGCKDARSGSPEEELFRTPWTENEIHFRVRVDKGAICTFSYSADGRKFYTAGTPFEARPGRWIGARIGYFALRETGTNDSGFVDIDWFRIGK